MRALSIPLLVLCAFTTVNAAPLQTSGSTGGATTASVPQVSASHDGIILAGKEDYRIGLADTVEVSVLKMPELSREYRINADGMIEMPFLGQIKADAKTSRELAADITKALQGGYLVDPQVSVIVKEVNRHFFIQGAVRSPGVYTIEGRPTLLELLTMAGGLDPNHGSTAFVIHKTPPAEKDGEATYDMKKANLNSLMRGQFSENLKIESDDIVQIPPSDIFFVTGEVKNPGFFPLSDGMTLRQAIALAHNTNPTADGKGIIFRDDQTGNKKEVAVNVADIMHGRSPDIPILANDIVVVPNSKVKSATLPVLNAFGMAVGYAGTRVIP